MSANSLMKNRCTVNRPTKTWDGGKTTFLPAVLATDVRCLMQEGRGQVNYLDQGASLEFDAMLFVRKTQDIRAGSDDNEADTITMTRPAGGTFLVKKIGDESGFENHRTAYLRRVPPRTKGVAAVALTEPAYDTGFSLGFES